MKPVLHPVLRLLFHLLLAVFAASAANKFFVADLESEAEHGFYARIFAFEGDAPDQYRILPLLVLRMLTEWLDSFHYAVLLLNFVCSFLAFELLYRFLGYRSVRTALVFNLLLAAVHIYLQFTGWRPDTLALFLPCLLLALHWKLAEDGPLHALLSLLLITGIAFSRAEIALAYAVFYAAYMGRNLVLRALLLLIPVAVQVILQFFIFPDAPYYTHKVMLLDNLGGFYFAYNPASWLLLALIVLYHREIYACWQRTRREYLIFYLILAGYLLLVLCVGRINEYRLYLPLLPLALWVDFQTHGRK